MTERQTDPGICSIGLFCTFLRNRMDYMTMFTLKTDSGLMYTDTTNRKRICWGLFI